MLVVNVQLRKIHAYPFIKPHDSVEFAKYSQVVLGSVNVLTLFGCEMDIDTESVLNSAIKKLLIELKNKSLANWQKYDASYKKTKVISAWLKNIAEARDKMRLHFGSASGKAITSFARNSFK